MQMLRVDHEIDKDLSQQQELSLLKKAEELTGKFNPSVIIFQDYNKGVLTPGVIRGITALAGKAGIPVVVDPKKKNFEAYQSIRLFKPNLKEIREGLRISVDPASLESLNHAAGLIHSSHNADLVMITLSEEGIFISDRKESSILKAHVRSVADVSGAGDTVISVAALCIASGTAPGIMAAIANLAGGIVCEQVGVVPISREALLAETISLAEHKD
jgi:rfaE bifunctional protein kinase chain/domain